MKTFNSWGHFPPATVSRPHRVTSSDRLPEGVLLPRGLGRSYGDCCLNNGHTLLLTESLGEVMSLDTDSGVVRLGGGVSFDQLMRLCIPRGWFPPVVPGTK